MAIEDIIDPYMVVERMISGTYQRALKGDLEAIFVMGNQYWRGHHIEKDAEKALRLYELAARKGYLKAQKRLGYIYYNGGDDANKIGVDFEKSADWYLEAARRGDARSQYEYGYCCYYGLGREQSFPEAFDWLSLAAEHSDYGLCYLGELYRNGWGVERNYRSAAKWYRKGAKSGSTYCSMMLGRLYLEGKGVARDPEKAGQLMSYECSFDESAVHMGYLYEDGYPFNESMEDALWWYRLSADQDDPNGLSNLGNLYCQGKGVDRDYDTALRLIMRAADKQYPYAYRTLGEMYERGEGVPKDLAMAIEMYKRAVETGCEGADKELERLMPIAGSGTA